MIKHKTMRALIVDDEVMMRKLLLRALVSADYGGVVKVWDTRPRAEQEALDLIRFYFAPPISKDELLARIRADATVSEPVRERALEFVRQSAEGKQ